MKAKTLITGAAILSSIGLMAMGAGKKPVAKAKPTAKKTAKKATKKAKKAVKKTSKKSSM